MSRAFREAGRVAKLVALSESPNEHEAARAREKALEALRGIDLEYLETLAEQRAALLRDLAAENRRLSNPMERPGKRTTGELLLRADLLLHHYERADALISAIRLLRQLG